MKCPQTRLIRSLLYFITGDKQRPKCGRCTTRGLDCVPVERKAVFRRGAKDGAAESFAVDQTWVNSEPRKWRRTETAQGSVGLNHSTTSSGLFGEEEQGTQAEDAAAFDPVTTLPQFDDRIPARSFHDIPISGLDALVSAAVGIQHDSPVSGGSIGASHGSPYEVSHISPSAINSCPSTSTFQPLANVEEACLLRYFIEELSPWVCFPTVYRLY